MRDEVAHTKMRTKMAPGVSNISPRPNNTTSSRLTATVQYSGKENESMNGTIDAHIARLISLLETKYLSTPDEYRPVDFAQKIQFLTLDIISDLAFGQPFGYVEQDDDVFDFIKITRAYFPVTLVIANIPSLVKLLHSWFFRGALPKESDKLGFGAFIGYAQRSRPSPGPPPWRRT